MTQPNHQQDFLREAMATLNMTRSAFAARIGVKPRALAAWLLPSDSKEFRTMPEIAWKFIREILAHPGQPAA